MRARILASEVLLKVASSFSLRRSVMQTEWLHTLVDTVLAQQELGGELMENLVGVLGALCSVRKSKFYIPGETYETGELRRKAMEKGVFTVLRWVHART